MTERSGTIKIGKSDASSADLCGLTPDKITYLHVYADKKQADLSLLSDYPNVTSFTERNVHLYN